MGAKGSAPRPPQICWKHSAQVATGAISWNHSEHGILTASQGTKQRLGHRAGRSEEVKSEMARIAPVRRDESKDLETVFEITEAVFGFFPNSMLLMARDPHILAPLPELSALIFARPGRLVLCVDGLCIS